MAKNDDKACPIILVATRGYRNQCLGKACAWWCEFAKECSFPLIAGILADSTICRNVWETEDNHGE